MSACVCLLDRSGADADPLLLRRLAEPFEAYGGTSSTVCRGPVGVSVQHGRSNVGSTTSSDPVIDPDSGALAALSGTMNAVDSASMKLNGNIHLEGLVAPSQALAAFSQDGVSFLERTAGSFVFLVGDPHTASLTIARDHLGGCKLYYYLDPRWLIAASEPSAILRHDAVSNDIDGGSVARFLGFRFPHTTASFFGQIKELPPAHCLRVSPRDSQIRQYWRFTARDDERGKSPKQVRSDFLAQLKQSVINEMAGLEPGRVGISLSGGLDSTSVAALSPVGTSLHSWYFDDIPDRDERRNIKLVAEYLQRPVQWTRGDGLHPLCGDYIDSFVHENSPHLNAFAALKRGLYNAAGKAGCERVLVGDGGDALYAGRDYWLRDLLRNKDPASFRSLMYAVRSAVGGDRPARLALRRLLPVRHIRATFRQPHSPWLTNAAHAALPGDELSPILPAGGSKYRFDPGVGAKHSEVESEERRLFAQCGIERGNPFWHWPLLESALNLPAWWFYRDGCTKVLTREAMKGLLPDEVRDSPRVGLLGTFFLRGIELNRAAIRETVFRNPRSDWQRYVRRGWLEPYLAATDTIAFGHTILWRVISYELWCRRLIQ